MDTEFARAFAQEWIDAWNAHDLERLLSHYADDVVFSSPHVAERFGKSSGVVEGKAELRAYWGAGLTRESTLHFTLADVRVSIDTLVVNYRSNLADGPVSEVMRFRDGLVVWGCAAYGDRP